MSFWPRLLIWVAGTAITAIVMVFVLDTFGSAWGGLVRTAIGGGVSGVVAIYLSKILRKDGAWRRASD